jgi:hypothetical protein
MTKCAHCRKNGGEISYAGYKWHRDCFIKRIRAHVASLVKRAEIFLAAGITDVEEVKSVQTA